MRMSSEKRTIWIIVKDGEVMSDLKRFQFNCVDGVEEEDKVYEKTKFLEDLAEQLGLSGFEKTSVLKLRNGRGSLIPLSRRTPENTVTSKTSPRRIDVPSYNETYQRKLTTFTKRISRLEETLPQLSLLRDAKLSAEVKTLGTGLMFLNSNSRCGLKTSEADSRQWKGMFTLNILFVVTSKLHTRSTGRCMIEGD
ncbi:uncharacterized protein [Pocillopora verrucosa]|uniref:uncharacterized protein n=1 Tax=Pocillopora verrucosa TaxID=203993 RepID=UPI0033425DBD